MSNFIETFKKGQEGGNFGLTTGIPPLDVAINGIQRKMTISIAAAPKVGKTTLADFMVLSVFLEWLANQMSYPLEFIYFSFEIDRVAKEFKFAAFFMAKDHGVYSFTYKNKAYSMCSDYLEGKLIHREEGSDEKEMIPMSAEHNKMLQDVYYRRIIPLFGEWSADNRQIKPGIITFIAEPDNPTGLDKYLRAHAMRNGNFVKGHYMGLDENGQPQVREQIIGYTPNDESKYTIIITDHTRKLKRERGFTMKENIDKYLEYTTWIRNTCKYTFIHIIHSGRGLSNMERLKYAGEFIFPTADDTKDTGNIAEETTVLLTMFNPNDEKYNLDKHFGVEVKNFPYYRSIHLTDSRNTPCPAHVQTNMFGGINMFSPLNNANG